MPDEVVDSILATVAAEQETEAADNTPELAVQPEAATEQKQPETTEPQDAETQEAEVKDTVEFPKKALNAISRRDKQIGKLRAQNEVFQAQLAELQASVQKVQPAQRAVVDPNQPQEEQFDNYGEYLKASIKYELAKDKSEAQPQQNQPTPEQIKHYQQTVERVKAIEAQELEFMKTAPDYKEVEAEYQDLIDQAPADLVNLFLEVENPPQAFYTLAKQGKLEALLDMPLHKAAIEIGKAMAVGVPQTKRVSSAPRPIQANTGTGTGSKSIDQMTYEEILASG
jgi:hypothetical protein